MWKYIRLHWDTYGPLSTRRERTRSMPNSHTFMHSLLISIIWPWKFSWSYKYIWRRQLHTDKWVQHQTEYNLMWLRYEPLLSLRKAEAPCGSHPPCRTSIPCLTSCSVQPSHQSGKKPWTYLHWTWLLGGKRRKRTERGLHKYDKSDLFWQVWGRQENERMQQKKREWFVKIWWSV